MSDWSIPLAYGVGIFTALELVRLLLGRWLPGFRLRVFYHLWSVNAGLVVALVVAAVGRESLPWKIAATSAAVLSALVAFALVDALILQRPWASAGPPMLPKLARDVLRMGLLVAVGLLAAKAVLQQPLGAILVSSTVLSAVAGLALQDVLKNVFAGMALDLEKPFVRGDWLMLDGVTPVQVIDLSWRSTRLRTKEGVDISEPNVNLANSRVTNYGTGARPVALGFRLGLPYEAPPIDVKRALRAAAESVPETLREPAVQVFVESFDDHSIGYYLRVWTRSVADMGRFQDAVNSRIWYQLKRRGLSIPFPIRTVHLHGAEEMAAGERQRGQARAVRLFSEIELFGELDGAVIAELAAGAARRDFDDGEILVREDGEGDSLMVIESGAAVVTKSAGDGGGAIEVARLAAGDFFGERSLLTGEARSATVTADGGCVVLELAKDDLAEVLARDPLIAESLSRALAARETATSATLERYQDQLRGHAEGEDEGTILRRIRAFFRLG